jgi:hypothetical protein
LCNGAIPANKYQYRFSYCNHNHTTNALEHNWIHCITVQDNAAGYKQQIHTI